MASGLILAHDLLVMLVYIMFSLLVGAGCIAAIGAICYTAVWFYGKIWHLWKYR